MSNGFVELLRNVSIFNFVESINLFEKYNSFAANAALLKKIENQSLNETTFLELMVPFCMCVCVCAIWLALSLLSWMNAIKIALVKAA